ncbi:hypothetical protein AB0I84_31555 [Streptomyces spectabilis]|uniref:hypothetical protein n=1 Tax=Streptomyces spectabilis TaxID=68270 RepID=UPI0033CEF014
MIPTAFLAVAIIVATLVIRTALQENRSPGSARSQWKFLRNPGALIAGFSTFLVFLLAIYATGSDWNNVAWSALAALLVAFIYDEAASGKR